MDKDVKEAWKAIRKPFIIGVILLTVGAMVFSWAVTSMAGWALKEYKESKTIKHDTVYLKVITDTIKK